MRHGTDALWDMVLVHCVIVDLVCFIITGSATGRHNIRLWCNHWWYSWHHGAWWRHQIETVSTLLAIRAGNSPVPGEFPAQRPVARSFDVFFDLRLNKRLSKQSWGWCFETLSCLLWRHCNGICGFQQTSLLSCCNYLISRFYRKFRFLQSLYNI